MDVSYACSCLFSTASAWRMSETLKKISNKLWKKLADKYEETIEDEICFATETTKLKLFIGHDLSSSAQY